jgi:hypothetical protein
MGNVDEQKADDCSWLKRGFRQGLSYTIPSATWLGPSRQELERRKANELRTSAKSMASSPVSPAPRKRHSPRRRAKPRPMHPEPPSHFPEAVAGAISLCADRSRAGSLPRTAGLI